MQYSSLSAVDWFQNFLWMPESVDAQALCIKWHVTYYADVPVNLKIIYVTQYHINATHIILIL